VHLFGLCVDIDALRALLPSDVRIIEDAACAAGAALRGRSAGALGDAGVFSFHPRKSITTGEGGMITTDDESLAEFLRSIRNHGASISEEDRHRGPQPYSLPEFTRVGYNYRMTDLQGALGVVQLSRLDHFIAERATAARRYSEALAGVGWLRAPVVPAGYVHGWQAYVCYVDPASAPMPRNTLMRTLQDEHGISTRPGTHAVHMLRAYRERFGFVPEDFPGARDCHNYAIALPLHNRMSEDDYSRVIDALRSLR
jgi:dTDP-4-amino-4,6-dideoxygalactose transaminase